MKTFDKPKGASISGPSPYRLTSRPGRCLLIAISISALLGVTACGQRGPLYLPKPPEVKPPATQPGTPNDGAQTNESGRTVRPSNSRQTPE